MFNEIFPASQVVISHVTHWLHYLIDFLNLKEVLREHNSCSLFALQLHQLQVKIRRPLLVHRRLPPVGKMKFNIDGSSLGNPGPAGSGGILRDDGGGFVFCFSLHLGEETNMFDKVIALKQSLLYCLQLGFNDIVCESDSAKLVHWFGLHIASLPWTILELWDDIIAFGQSLSFALQHAYRERNSIADQLEKAHTKGLSEVFLLSSLLPRLAWGELKLDLNGLSKFRHRLQLLDFFHIHCF